jgi:hypothetical protein
MGTDLKYRERMGQLLPEEVAIYSEGQTDARSRLGKSWCPVTVRRL